MASMAEVLWHSLPDSTRSEVLAWLFGHELTWFSGCSGTDSPDWVFTALTALLGFTALHMASAEHNSAKRQWIRRVCNPRWLFQDLFDLSRITARCERGVRVVMAMLDHLDLFVAGFSCKDLSALNTAQKNIQKLLRDGGGTSGSTLAGVLLVLQWRRPRSFIFENVPNLRYYMAPLAKRMQALGYIIVWRVVDALESFTPQRRLRLYIVGWLRADLEASGMDINTFAQEMSTTWSDLLKDNPVMDIDDFLLPDDDPGLVAHQRALIAKMHGDSPLAHVSKEQKWHEKNKLILNKRGVKRSFSNWRPCYAEQMPDFPNLPARCQELLDSRQLEFPDTRRLLVRIDQSDANVSEAIAPCMNPGGIIWIAHKARLMRAWEKLSLQAIYCTPAQVATFGENLVSDLAGNAFCASSCLVAVLVSLIGRARITARATQATAVSADPAPSRAQSSSSSSRPKPTFLKKHTFVPDWD